VRAAKVELAAASVRAWWVMQFSDSVEIEIPESIREASGSATAIYEKLREKIAGKTAVVAICGLGYVGLPLALAIAENGSVVVALDIDAGKVEKINSGRSYVQEISSSSVEAARKTGRLRATSDFKQLRQADVIAICVPTPVHRNRSPDISHIVSIAESIADNARPGQLIILESTTYPGTTAEVLGPILARRGFLAGRDIFLAFSPERVDPGNFDYRTALVPKVVGGEGAMALDLAAAFYGGFCKTIVPVSSACTAEAVKLTENVFRAVNIALVNELKVVFANMGIDIWEVLDAAKTKPFGFMAFYPGPGPGGHCIPIDPLYLTWKAREFDVATNLIDHAAQINAAMPCYVVGRLCDEINQRFGKGLCGTRVLVLGIAYKRNIDDIRGSAAFKLMKLLEDRHAIVDYFDPYVPKIPRTDEHPSFAGRRSVGWDPEMLASYDAVLIATDHDGIDYKMLVDKSRLVVDTRNVCERVGVRSAKVAKA
jgi:UDP-N-acetyl-D-glucosamine dehydrogenase